MSGSRRFEPGDEALGRVLRDAVEGRGRPVKASLAGTGVGSRAFVSAVERVPDRSRQARERPRFGAIVLATVAVAVAATALALWPAVTGQRAPARPHAAPSPAGAAAMAADGRREAGRVVVAPAAADRAPAGPAAPAARPAPAPPNTGVAAQQALPFANRAG